MGSSFICQDPAPPPMESALMASGGLGGWFSNSGYGRDPFFFFTSSGSFHQVDGMLGILFGDLEDVLKLPDMLWFDPMYELKKRHLRTDILRHEGVSEETNNFHLTPRLEVYGSSRNMLGEQLVLFHKKGQFLSWKEIKKRIWYIYIYTQLTQTLDIHTYLNQDFPVYPWTSRNFVTGIYTYIYTTEFLAKKRQSVSWCPKNYNSGPTLLCK